MAERSSPSPSPSRKLRSISTVSARLANARGSFDTGDEDDVGVDDDDEDDDEETLQLKLQAIEAKLKLKALQRKQKKAPGGSSDVESGSATRSSRPLSAAPDILAASRAQSRAAMLAEGPRSRPRSHTDVQVPVSPVRRAQMVQEQTSPTRVLLGIDKGLRAKDVSLKRASSVRKLSESRDAQTGGYLRRTHTPALSLTNQPSFSTSSQDRPKSFSERLAAARNEEASRKDRKERIQQTRSKAFSVGQEEVDRYKEQATEIPDMPQQTESYSRAEILAASGIRRSNTTPSIRRDNTQDTDTDVFTDSSPGATSRNTKKTLPEDVSDSEATSFEPYSGVHLSKRILPHNLLTRTFAGKKILLIKDLLAQVKSPEYQLPDIEQDIVILGIIASKSDPKSHKAPETQLKEKKSRFAEEDQPGKYMVLNMADLTWELELFLFNSAFTRYWKLVPGTLVAILNPTIMPPPKGREHTGRFSLVLNSDGDSVLEIGTARDLGYCKSVKKDGKLCDSWVNKKRTEFCEFHMNLALDKHRLARQDVNSGFGMGPGNRSKNKEKFRGEPKDRRNGYDRYTHTQFFVSKASAASLLDGEQMLPGQYAERAERGDALRRKLAHQEKEREIMKQLGQTGRGAGREYMQVSRVGRIGSGSTDFSTASTAASSSAITADSSLTAADTEPPRDAKSLGLIAPKGRSSKVHLSPIKRKRDNSIQGLKRTVSGSASGSGSSGPVAPLGWGGNLKDKLARMKSGERLDGKTVSPPTAAAASSSSPSLSLSFPPATKSTEGGAAATSKGGVSPARKKTRFVTEKGIREAGRESLGGELIVGRSKTQIPVTVGLDSDDELEILM
jgi:minichromosome maintenance protein 10